MSHLKTLFFPILFILSIHVTATGTELPETFHFSGQLTDGANAPILDSVVLFNIKIYNPSESCLLYEEEQTHDLSLSNGNFNLSIGSAVSASQRVGVDPNNSMLVIFNNSGGSIPCGPSGSYSPAANAARRLVITVDPSTGPAETLPGQDIMSVPFAKNSESLQGKVSVDFLQVDAANDVTQSNLMTLLNGTNISNLTTLAAGTSTLYTRQSLGAMSVPTNASDPGSLTAGKVWYDSTNNVLKYYNGTTTRTVMESGGGSTDHNTLTNLTTGDPHTQYVFGAGRAGGQTLHGGTAANQNLTLESTSNATKGSVVIAPTNGNVGIGVASPTDKLEVNGNVKVAGHIQVADSASGCTNAAADGGKMRYNSTSGFMEYCNHIAGSWTSLRSVDATPDPFTFTDQTGQPLNSIVYSPSVSFSNFDGPLTASVSGDGNPQICNLSTSCVYSSSVSVFPGQMVQVYTTSPITGLSTHSVTITVGTTSDVWDITTATADSTPDSFNIVDHASMILSTLHTSEYVFVYGFNTSVSISVSGDGNPEICTQADGCTTWATSFPNFYNSYYFRVRATTAVTEGTTHTITVNIGGVTETMVLTTITTADCAISPSVGNFCLEGTIYAGNFGGFDLMTTPGGCNNIATPTCVGEDNLYLAYGSNGYSTGATSFTDGVTNTNALIAGAGTWGAVPAAQYCYDLIYGGYSDWYLPSKDELNWLYTNKTSINGLISGWYTSSTESSSSSFHDQYFGGGGPSTFGKSNAEYIRCIRRY